MMQYAHLSKLIGRKADYDVPTDCTPGKKRYTHYTVEIVGFWTGELGQPQAVVCHGEGLIEIVDLIQLKLQMPIPEHLPKPKDVTKHVSMGSTISATASASKLPVYPGKLVGRPVTDWST